MDRPMEQQISFFRTWLSRPECGDNFLRGAEASIWTEQNDSDLVAMSTGLGEHDVFEAWLANVFLRVFHRYIGQWIYTKKQPDEEACFTQYRDSRVTICLKILVTLLSSIMPVMSTLALYLVKGMALRFILVAIFVTLFCFALAIFTNARRVEIFAASAA